MFQARSREKYMVKNQKYILIQDTEGVFSRISGNTKVQFSLSFTKAIENYLITLKSSLRTAFNNAVDIQTYSWFQIEKTMLYKVTRELEANSNAVCICLDRFLLTDIETSDAYRQRFFRFEICRSLDDKKIPRQGSMSFPKQLATLRKSMPELDNKQLIIVDDGIFSGGTVKEFLKLLSVNGIKASIKKVICFVSNKDRLKDFPLIPLEVIKPVKNLYDWVNTRDFSPFGGKILYASINNKDYSSIPYLYPWSYGDSASLSLSPHLFTVSRNMIRAFKELVIIYEGESGNKQLIFKNVVRHGFSLPTNLRVNLPIDINDSVTKYLDSCVELIEEEQNRQVAIFDMDGVLYQLDGKNNGYHGSALEKIVLENAKTFIKTKENCNSAQVNAILKIGLADTIGLSSYLSRRYGISRLDYFNCVWNMSPEKIIRKANKVAEIKTLLKRNPQIKLILLTSAPRVWTRKVINYLGIDKFFESIYTGEQYGQKEEIFTLLAGRYKPQNIISIGNQYQTDIKPAKELGMHVFEVTTPKDLKKLSNDLFPRS